MMRALLVLLLLSGAAYARDDGRYANSDPWVRGWFKSQKVPGTAISCCDISDGTHAEEDIRNGSYWVRYVADGTPVDWTLVPDSVVIREPNHYGRAVVWFGWENGKPKIRCFIPGAGI